MEDFVFGKKTPRSQTPRVDRFIAPRTAVSEMCRRRSLGYHILPTKDIWYREHVLKRRYSAHIGSDFGLTAKSESVLVKHWCQDRSYIQPWPCVPRKKSYLSSADSVLDLPGYKYAPWPDLLDWSGDDILVAALGRGYYKWSWHTQALVGRGMTDQTIFICKFDPDGDLLALGTGDQTVEIHDTERGKCLAKSRCQCFSYDKQDCTITAVDWSPTGNSFVTGCSRGSLTAHSRDAKVLNWCKIAEKPIRFARISPDARYVAASVLTGDSALVLTWTSLKSYSTVKSDWSVKTIAWHPWRSALLGIGATIPDDHSMLAIWDAPPAKPRQAFISPRPCKLDCMQFSHRTGEMVLGLFTEDPPYTPLEKKMGSRIVVLSDPDTVVDEWGEGKGYLERVRTMVFSPDGSKLATATMGEDLIIWNFLPEDKRKRQLNIKRKRYSAIPVLLDQSLYGFSLR